MKKTLGTMVAAMVVVLCTGTFAMAEYAAAGVGNFPYFQLGCLIIGGMTIISLKHKYEKMYTGEVAGVFARLAYPEFRHSRRGPGPAGLDGISVRSRPAPGSGRAS